MLRVPIVEGPLLTVDNAARANYDKYDIQNEARIARRPYLEGQQVIETCVADAVIAFVASLEVSDTLSASLQQETLAALQAYRDALGPLYAAAYAVWDDADDLCTDQTPLGAAMKALGRHSKQFVTITRALRWEDVRDAPVARARLKADLTSALVERLGVSSDRVQHAGVVGPGVGQIRIELDRALELALGALDVPVEHHRDRAHLHVSLG